MAVEAGDIPRLLKLLSWILGSIRRDQRGRSKVHIEPGAPDCHSLVLP